MEQRPADHRERQPSRAGDMHDGINGRELGSAIPPGSGWVVVATGRGASLAPGYYRSPIRGLGQVPA